MVFTILTVTLGCASGPTQTTNTGTNTQSEEILVVIDKAKSFVDDYYISETTKSNWNAGEGKCFFGLYVIIENINCDKAISTHPWGFEITIDNVVYDPTTYIGANELATVDLLKGGKTEGYIVFEIPKSYMEKGFEYYILYTPLLSGYGCDIGYKFIESETPPINQEKEETLTNEPSLFVGTGNKIVSFNAAGTGTRTFTMNHMGDTGSFKIVLYDGQEKYVSTLIMSRGREIDSQKSEKLTPGKYYLDVTASGYWTIEIQ